MKIRTLSTVFLPLALGACGGDGGLTTSTANRPPSIVATRNPAGDPIVGVTTVTFSAFAIDPDGNDVTCFWDLGDGMRPGLRASRLYPMAGAFPANVTCTDARGASATLSSTVTVRTP
jgi:hypothetical protein